MSLLYLSFLLFVWILIEIDYLEKYLSHTSKNASESKSAPIRQIVGAYRLVSRPGSEPKKACPKQSQPSEWTV